MDNYPIWFGQEPIGTAILQKQGLYYRIHCRCRCSGEVPLRVVLHCGEMDIELGICVPCADGVESFSRIPIKRIRDGEVKFTAYPGRTASTLLREISVHENEPFRHIAMLQKAYLIRGGNNAAIGIKDRSSDQPDSGRNP